MSPMDAYKIQKAPEVSKKSKALKLNFAEEAALTVVCKRQKIGHMGRNTTITDKALMETEMAVLSKQ